MGKKDYLPLRVVLQEVVTRDGLQNEKKILTVDEKVSLINSLIECGLTRIEVSSFVNPRLVPQMANAEELWGRIKRDENVVYSALVLSENGLERAIQCNADHIGVWVSASETHSMKNNNKTIDESLRKTLLIVKKAKAANTIVRVGIMCAFGCAYEGMIPQKKIEEIVKYFKYTQPDEVCLADTSGMANPVQVETLVTGIKKIIGETQLSLHLHNTRGLGLVNAYAAMQKGVRLFDSSLGGVGGCPFIPNASGNIATEDVSYMLQSIGIQTGVDSKKLINLSIGLGKLLGKELPSVISKLYSDSTASS